MRCAVWLLMSGLLGCATPPSAPMSDKAAPAAPAAAVDVDALIKRDGLLAPQLIPESDPEESVAIELVSVTYAELNGVAPAELIVHTRRRRIDWEANNTLWLYDVSRAGDPQPIPVAPQYERSAKRVHGGLSWSDEAGTVVHRVEDIDGDGRAEIVMAGGRYDAPSVIWVRGWGRDAGGEGVIDKLPDDPGGVEVLALDVDGDGRRELVSISREMIALRPDEEGMWREAAAPEAVLPAALDALVIGRSGVSQGLPYVVALMRAAKIGPRDVARLQDALEAQLTGLGDAWKQPSEEREQLGWLADAMVWPGNTRAYEVLLPYVRGPHAMLVAAALLELDAQTGQKRGQEALLGELDALWAGALYDREHPQDRLLRCGALLDVLALYKVEAAAKRLREAFEARQVTLELASEAMWRIGEPRGVVASLWRGADEAQLAWFLTSLWGQIGAPDAPRAAHRAAWLEMFEVEEVRGWLARPALYPVAAQIALYKGDAGLRDEVWRRLGDEQMVWARDPIFRVAARVRAPLPPDKLVASWMRGSSDTPYALWAWAFEVGDAAQLKKMLARGVTIHVLDHMPVGLYATGAPCEEAPRGPRGCITTRGKLAGELALLHKITAAELESSDGVYDAAVQVLGRLRYEPSRRLLVALASEPGERQQLAQRSLFQSGHWSVSEYIGALLRAPSRSRHAFRELGEQLSVEDAGLLVGWLVASGSAADDAGALDALRTAAPRVCAAEVGRLGALVDDAQLSCEVRLKAAGVLATCDASWLAQLASEARAQACDGRFVGVMLASAYDGGAAHLRALEALAEASSSPAIREEAHRALRALKARGAPKP